MVGTAGLKPAQGLPPTEFKSLASNGDIRIGSFATGAAHPDGSTATGSRRGVWLAPIRWPCPEILLSLAASLRADDLAFAHGVALDKVVTQAGDEFRVTLPPRPAGLAFESF
jgi:hypothetical protein